LSSNKLKADLVQLNGYYQYSSNLIYNIEFFHNPIEEIWNLIEDIFNDPQIGQIHSINNFASKYNLEPSRLINLFKQLRLLGYEIRNHNTNPEISINDYLVPYKFPTLTPLSVQLKRNL